MLVLVCVFAEYTYDEYGKRGLQTTNHDSILDIFGFITNLGLNFKAMTDHDRRF